ncbi:MAG: S41 family peptidase [Bacteroidales bacterium]
MVFKNFNNPELSLETDSKTKTAILTIDSFIYYDRRDYFSNFLDSCFREINNDGITKLVIDLRNNDGGDPYAAAALFSHLEPEPLPYYAEPYNHYEELADPIPLSANRYTGRLAILISGRCFSTNGHFCALLKYHHIGTLIGTPAGATYKCNGGRDGVRTLENSKIMLYFTRASYAVAVTGMDKHIPVMPDILIEETPGDIAAGRDPAMETAIYFLEK